MDTRRTAQTSPVRRRSHPVKSQAEELQIQILIPKRGTPYVLSMLGVLRIQLRNAGSPTLHRATIMYSARLVYM